MKKSLALFFISAFIFTSCDSLISTVRDRDIINNSSHTAQFTLISHGNTVFTLQPAERMTLKLPSFPAGKIISDKPIVFKTYAENATIEDMPTYELNVVNTFTHQIMVKVQNDRFASPQSITIPPAATGVVHTRLNPNDIRFDFTCDVGGYRYENYFDKNDKKYYLKIY